MLTYVKGSNDFTTPMNYAVPSSIDGEHHVYFFNPGSDLGRKSVLRLINFRLK